MISNQLVSVALILVLLVNPVSSFVEGLYCGVDSCYDVLGVTRDATRSDISKAYRKLARKLHPDVSKEKNAEEKFRLLATAYETLKDEEARKDYDYMLDNPDEAYYHYYQYYKRRVTPKVDVRIVLAVSITILSILQYFHKSRRYEEAIKYAMQNPKYRNQALKIIHDEGLLDKSKKVKNKRSKEEKKLEEERVLREIVEDSIDVRGGYSKAKITDVLWVQLFLSPIYLYQYLAWLLAWTWKFTVCKQEYGQEEKEYLTRKSLKLSENYWDALDEDSKDIYLEKELWIADNLKLYKQELEEEYRVKMADSGRAKMWRRYMKSGGPGRMTFGED